MRRRTRQRACALLLAAALLYISVACGQATAEVAALPTEAAGQEAEAAALVRDLVAGEHRKLLGEYTFSEQLSAALSASVLRRSMQEILETYGPAQEVQEVASLPHEGGVDCYVTVSHREGQLVYAVSFDAQGRVAALSPEPSFDAAVLLQPPARELPEGAQQAEAVAGNPQRAGAMVQPAGGSEVVVLLVGPADRDRDGGFGGSLPLRDIACDLAERGIASLRLDGAELTQQPLTERQEVDQLAEILRYLQQHREGFDTILVATPSTGVAIAALEQLELPYWHCYELELARLPDGRTPELADPGIAAEIAAQVYEITGTWLVEPAPPAIPE